MESLIEYLKKHGGYARMKGMKASGYQTRLVRRLLEEGQLVKVKNGLYRLASLQPSETTGLVEVCLAMPKAIICLGSALAFHELTTFIPASVSYAIPQSGKPAKLDHPPGDAYFFSLNQYRAGMEHRETPSGPIRIYGREKTVCDMFRYRNKFGEDLALEGLKEYLKRRDRNLSTLAKFAEICRVKGIVSSYVRALA
jgi:predicted transcriptional regulator of viral defense system